MTIRSYQYQVQAVITPPTGPQESVSHNLNLQQTAIGVVVAGGVSTVVQDLGITDEVKVFGYEVVEQDLGITDDVQFIAPIAKSLNSNLGLTQVVEFGFNIKNEIIEQDLGLTDTASRAFTISVVQSLGLTDEAVWLNVADDLNLTDLAEWGYGFDLEDNLNLTDLAERDAVLNQSLSDDNIISQSVAYFIESRCGRYEFQSFHGEGGVPPEPQRLSYKNTFLLQSLDTGDVLVLRNPETDDRRRYSFNRTSRRFFDGTLDLFATEEWVTQQTQIYTITALKRDKLDELFTFLTDNLGREILIKDWRGQSWISIILNPGEVYTEDGEGYWTIDFEVEGERTPGEFVLDRLNLADDLSRAGSIWTRQASNDLNLVDRANREIPLPAENNLGMSDVASFVIV